MSIKILHCIHSLSGGGAERQLNIITNHSKEANLDFGIFCINSSNNNIKHGACELFELSDKTKYPWFLLKELRKVINEFRPDVVHCWLPLTLITPGLLAAKMNGLPAVSSYRSSKQFNSWKDVCEFFANLFFADAIISNSSPTQSNKFFQSIYNSKINDLIPNAVDIPKQFRKKKQFRKTNQFFTILFVGRLIDIKNWQTLLDALAEFKDVKSWRLLICGTGDDDKVKDRIQELNLSRSIEMLGFRNDVYSIMAESDLLVLPSWHEGMPNVVLEALSIGLPCVLSRIPAHINLLKDEDFCTFFDPANSHELAEILNSFINDEVDITELSKKGIKFSEEFLPSVLIKKYSKFYKNVLGQKSE